MSETFRIGGQNICLGREDVENRLRNVPPENIRESFRDGQRYTVTP